MPLVVAATPCGCRLAAAPSDGVQAWPECWVIETRGRHGDHPVWVDGHVPEFEERVAAEQTGGHGDVGQVPPLFVRASAAALDVSRPKEGDWVLVAADGAPGSLGGTEHDAPQAGLLATLGRVTGSVKVAVEGDRRPAEVPRRWVDADDRRRPRCSCPRQREQHRTNEGASVAHVAWRDCDGALHQQPVERLLDIRDGDVAPRRRPIGPDQNRRGDDAEDPVR